MRLKLNSNYVTKISVDNYLGILQKKKAYHNTRQFSRFDINLQTGFLENWEIWPNAAKRTTYDVTKLLKMVSRCGCSPVE